MRKRATCLTLALLGLAACGGSGSTDGAPVVVTPGPTPSPSPSPSPSASPTPTALTIATPGLVGSLTVTAPDAQNATAFRAVVTDPDAPTATRYEAINFDGDETIAVRRSATTSPYDETFTPDMVEPQAIFFNIGTNGSNPRRFAALSYRKPIENDDTASILLPLLEESRKTASAFVPTLNYPEHVRLISFRRGVSINSMQLVGTATATGELPVSGTRTMVGESFGSRYFTAGAFNQAYIGDTVLSVDFGTRKVTGTVVIVQFLGLTPVRPALTMTINGTIAADGTLSGTVSVTGANAITEAGFLTGAVYGPQADEIGIVMSTSGSSGSIIAGLVAGQE